MADLTAADITVTLISQDVEFVGMTKKISFPSISFGDGSKTYGSGNGIPMPAMGMFGMKKEIKRVFITQPGNGYHYVWDRANHKLRIFQASHDLKFILGATGQALTIDHGTASLQSATNAETILGADAATKGGVVPGPLVEVPATHAPAETAIELMVVGH